MEKLMGMEMIENSQISETKSSDDILFLLKGIAHDYNNIVHIIQGNISLAKQEVEPNHDIYEYLISSEKGVAQVKELSRLLLSYTNGPMKKEAVSLQKIIQETSEFLLLNSLVDIVYDLPEKEI